MMRMKAEKKKGKGVDKIQGEAGNVGQVYVLICIIIIIAGALIIVILKIQLFPDQKIIAFNPLPQQVH